MKNKLTLLFLMFCCCARAGVSSYPNSNAVPPYSVLIWAKAGVTNYSQVYSNLQKQLGTNFQMVLTNTINIQLVTGITDGDAGNHGTPLSQLFAVTASNSPTAYMYYGHTKSVSQIYHHDDVCGWILYGLDDNTTSNPNPYPIALFSGYGSVEFGNGAAGFDSTGSAAFAFGKWGFSDSQDGDLTMTAATDDQSGGGSTGGTFTLIVNEHSPLIQPAVTNQQLKWTVGHDDNSDQPNWTNSLFSTWTLGDDGNRYLSLSMASNTMFVTSDYGRPSIKGGSAGLSFKGEGSGITNLLASGISTNGSTDGQVLLSSGGVATWGALPAADLPGSVVTNNNSGGATQVISGTNTFNGKLTVTNSLVVSGGTISGNGSGVTNGFRNVITKTNFLLATDFTNTTTTSELVKVEARCNPTTTGNALCRLLIDPTASGTFSITNQFGIEADAIFTTAPHVWSSTAAIIGPGCHYKLVDVSGEGLFTITNSYYQTTQ